MDPRIHLQPITKMPWKLLGTAVLCGVLGVAAGCGGDDAAGTGCVPGISLPCECSPGIRGAAVCRDDGSGFDACFCAGGGVGGTGGVGGVGGFAGTGGTGGTGGFAGTEAGTGGVAASGAGAGGTGGFAGTGGTGGDAGTAGTAGTGGSGGDAGTAGTGGSGGDAGTAGTGGTAGSAGAGGEDYGAGETGRMVGFTAAHNAVRARSHTPEPNPPLPPMRWSTELATIAQAYADQLAANNCAFQHSTGTGLGENLAGNWGSMRTPMAVTESWAGEEQCWTFGRFFQTDSCNMTCTSQMNSNGCGHYTQIIWRNTTELGCGVSTCPNGAERWVCNYRPPGNYINQLPY